MVVAEVMPWLFLGIDILLLLGFLVLLRRQSPGTTALADLTAQQIGRMKGVFALRAYQPSLVASSRPPPFRNGRT